jgi:hypothetical protein
MTFGRPHSHPSNDLNRRSVKALKPGDVVVGAFAGADTTKVRLAVVLSTELYQRHRPE